MLASAYKMQIGDAAPDFRDLPGVDGRSHSLSSFQAPVLVVAFTCNHCPYVQAYESRMMRFQKDYGPKGVQLVAVNSNETVNYPEDNFDEMVKRAKRLGLNFPYLRDEDQSVADAYGAQCTPHFLVFDAARKLRYQGRFDDNKDHAEQVKSRDLVHAVDAVLAGRAPPAPLTQAFGCSIKWTKV